MLSTSVSQTKPPLTSKSEESLSRNLSPVLLHLQHNVMEAHTAHAESIGLTEVSIPCATEEQMAHGEILARWAVSSNALQSRHRTEEESEGLGRC